MKLRDAGSAAGSANKKKRNRSVLRAAVLNLCELLGLKKGGYIGDRGKTKVSRVKQRGDIWGMLE